MGIYPKIDTVNLEPADFQREILTKLLINKKNEATELIVQRIKKDKFIYTTKDDLKSEMWIYKEGIYVPQGRSEIKEITRKILGEAYTTYICNNIIEKIEADTFIEQDKFFNNNYLNEVPVKNGILNIFTKELNEFDPKKVFFNKLPVTYDKVLECPKIEQFLKEVLKNEDDINLIYEIGGFCLLKEYKYEKSFIFTADGRNGKGKTIELIKRVIGIENCTNVPLSSIDYHSFRISELHGKMVNLAGEVSNKDMKETGLFKELTGRDFISAKRKFLRPINFQNYAKFIFACNALPMVYDTSKGFWDRWVLLEFPYTFITQSEYDALDNKDGFKLRDEHIIDKITTDEELSGLLNKFLEGLERLENNRDFSYTKGSKEVKETWIRKSNSFMAFCLDYIVEDYDNYMSKKELRKRYVDYCKKHKTKSKSDFVIKKVLQEEFGASEENKNLLGDIWEKCWFGIKFKD